MRISDWSSDVCSSDLQAERDGRQAEADHPLHGAAEQEDGGDPEQRQNIEGHGRLRGKKQSQRMVWQGGAPRCFGPGRSVAYDAAGTYASLARAGRRRRVSAKLARTKPLGTPTPRTETPPTPPPGH